MPCCRIKGLIMNDKELQIAIWHFLGYEATEKNGIYLGGENKKNCINNNMKYIKKLLTESKTTNKEQ